MTNPFADASTRARMTRTARRLVGAAGAAAAAALLVSVAPSAAAIAGAQADISYSSTLGIVAGSVHGPAAEANPTTTQATDGDIEPIDVVPRVNEPTTDEERETLEIPDDIVSPPGVEKLPVIEGPDLRASPEQPDDVLHDGPGGQVDLPGRADNGAPDTEPRVSNGADAIRESGTEPFEQPDLSRVVAPSLSGEPILRGA